MKTRKPIARRAHAFKQLLLQLMSELAYTGA